MPNNIIPLNDELKARSEEEAALSAEVFDNQTELTEEEKAKVAALEDGTQAAVVTTDANGRNAYSTLEDYAKAVDEAKTITGPDGALIKAVNQGDIKQTVEDLKADARARALNAFRSYAVATSVDGKDVADDDILRINDDALRAVQGYYGEERLDADKTIKKLSKLSLDQLANILPKQFLDIYSSEAEIRAKNFKAKERILSTLAYLMVTGPELDYLNEYIDHEHVMMEISRQLVQTEVSLADVLKDKDKMSNIVKRAIEYSEPDKSIWAKFIKDPKIVHNEFAQRAVVCEEYQHAYEGILANYPNDGSRTVVSEGGVVLDAKTIDDCRAQIQIQIDECINKRKAYLDVTNLELMRSLWGTLTARMKENKKNNFKNLTREAVSALDRIRKAKQNVPFPVYDEKLIKRADLLYGLYMKEFVKMLEKYNTAVDKVYKETDEAASTGVVPIRIDGHSDAVVWKYFAMLLLILYGRIMKSLGDRGITKYDAIMLDCYFQIFCKIGSDVYLMSDVWNICKEFVEYCIVNYPEVSKKK